MNNQDHNLFTHFQEQFNARADHELLTDTHGQSWRYIDVSHRSGQIAHFLRGLGAAPGDRVSVQVEKSVECLCLYLACLRSGLVYHPLNIAYTANELVYFLGDARPAIVVCDPDNQDAVEKIAAQTGTRPVLTMDALGKGSLADGANRANSDFETVARRQDDLAALRYSSGTTGVPKGIDGYVSIVGRAKDMVISGGLNVYPKEIEQFIDDLDGVSESAVIGVPHADFGEAVVAIVVPSTDSQLSAEDVLAACKGQMAGFKVPKRAILVAELPRNAMSKVQKNVLRDTYQGLFN